MELTPPHQGASLAIRSRSLKEPQSANQQAADEMESTSKSSEPAATQSLLTIPYDDLERIIQNLHFRGRSHLLILCRVSKRLYFACVPEIYRSIHIDFSNRVSKFLIYRLSNKQSRLPTHVRSLKLQNCQIATMQDWQTVAEALSLFTNLQRFSWDAHADLPESVLTTLSNQHPEASLNAKVNQLYAGQPAGLGVVQKRILASPVLGCLSTLDVVLVNPASCNNSFKSDLLILLSRSPNLTYLRIYCNSVQPDLAEMLRSCSNTRFPRLRRLCLQAMCIIFTQSELEIWGCQGAWAELRSLYLVRATDLIPFVCRAPKLTYLDLVAFGGIGMPELRTHLEGCQRGSLGPVKSLNYRHFIAVNHTSPAILEHIMPWPIISNVSKTLIKFMCGHQPYNIAMPTIATPTFKDIHRFRSSAPGITHLLFDICLQKEVWPVPILRELSRFSSLKNLTFFIHPFVDRNTELFTRDERLEKAWESDRRAYIDVFKTLAHGREKLPVHPNLDFCVEFKRVQSHLEVDRPFCKADFTITCDRLGQVTHKKYQGTKKSSLGGRERTSLLTLEELKLKEHALRPLIINYQTIGRDMPFDHHGKLWWTVRGEIRRRERQKQLGDKYGDTLFTLYDSWEQVKP